MIAFLVAGGLMLACGTPAQGAGFQASPPPKIAPEVLERARKGGRVRVIVSLQLAPNAVNDRGAIVHVQDVVLDRLRGTDYHLLQRYLTSPYLALEVGRDALDVLAVAPEVVSVSADFELAPSREG